MKFGLWLTLKRRGIRSEWMRDMLGYGPAIRALVETGLSIEQAEAFLIGRTEHL